MKPILKWVGGKTQILDQILDTFPKIINNYHELFLGGGSVLLGLLERIQNNKIEVKGNIYVYDKNPVLINMFINIKNNRESLENSMNEFLNIYTNLSNGEPLCKEKILELSLEDLKLQLKKRCLRNNDNTNDNETLIRSALIDDSDAYFASISALKSLGKKQKIVKPTTYDEGLMSKESYYYWIRKKYNDMSDEERNSIIGSAIFIFLNKTCFRGVYRMGPNGFNVPFGNYMKLKTIISSDELKNMSNMIQNVHFRTSDFTDAITNIRNEDFVYMDPPYFPINNKSFVNYQSGGFNDENHNSLFTQCHQFKANQISFVMSNSDTEKVRKEFSNYDIVQIKCRRAINSKKPESSVNEVIIKSYS